MSLEDEFKVAEEGITFCRNEALSHTLTSSSSDYASFAIKGYAIIERAVFLAGEYEKYEDRLRYLRRIVGDIVSIIPQ